MIKELIDAIISGDIERFVKLIKNGADIRQWRDYCGRTALCWAAGLGKIEMFEYLLTNQYFQITDKGPYGTPFRMAANNGNIEMCRYLIKKKYCQIKEEISEKNDNGETVVFLVARSGRSVVLEYFLAIHDIDLKETNISHGDNLLSISAHNGKVKMVAFLLKSGAYLDMVLNNGETAQSSIEKHSNKAALPLLQAAGMLMTLATGTRVQRTAEDLLKTLEDNLNARLIKTGNTALHLAIIHRQPTLVKLLLEKGADVSMPNNYNRTPLQLMEDAYSSEPYLITLSHISNIDRIGKTVEKTLNAEKTLGQNVEHPHKSFDFETKGNSEVELSKNAKVASLEKQCEYSLAQIEKSLEKLKTDEKDILCFKLGEMLADPRSHIFNPIFAYQLLFHISQSNVQKFQKSQEMMAILLISKAIILVDSESDEPRLSTPSMSLDNGLENDTHDALHLKAIIKHLMYSGASIHTGALGKFIAQYTMGSEKSVKGIDNVQGNDIESQLAIIEALRTQQKALKAMEVKLAAKEREIKSLAEEFEKLKSENRRAQQEIALLKQSNQSTAKTALTEQHTLIFSGAGAGMQKSHIDAAATEKPKKYKRRVKRRR